MSRHHIDAFDSTTHEVVVGYDRPLDHFFGQVNEIESGQSVIDELRSLEDVGTISELQDLIAPFAVIPNEVARALTAESVGLAPANRVVDHRAASTAGRPIDSNNGTSGTASDVEADQSWTIEQSSFIRDNDEVDITILRQAGEVPVAVVGTTANPSYFAAIMLIEAFPDRGREAEPFIYISRDPTDGRLEHVRFADFRLTVDDEQKLSVGPVVERGRIGQAGNEEEAIEKVKGAAPRQVRSR